MRPRRLVAVGSLLGTPLVVGILLLLTLVGGITVLATLNHGGSGGPSWTATPAKANDASRDAVPSVSDLNPDALLACKVTDQNGVDIDGATCTFHFGGTDVTLPATDAKERVLIPAEGSLTANAAGYYPQSRNVTVTADDVELFMLFAIPAPDQPDPADGTPPTDDSGQAGHGPGGQSGSGGQTGGGGFLPLPPDPVVNVTKHGWFRVWRDPIQVCSCGYEPGIIADKAGTIYYAPTSHLFRSDDGGASFHEITPTPPHAIPDAGSDTAVNVAPDGSLWWTHYWGYLGTTVGCTSVDRGNTWTCDNSAIPGVTDRMWIAGKDANTGFLETGEALSKPEWAFTSDGSFKYHHPCAVYTNNGQTGNMYYDSVHDKVLVYLGGGILWVDNPNGCLPVPDTTPPPPPGVIVPFNTGFGGTAAIPWLMVDDRGTYWSSRNPGGIDANNSAGLVLGRSFTEGSNWDAFPIRTATVAATDAKSISHSYSSAGPEDLLGSHIEGDTDPNGGPDVGDYALTMFYGSDREGPPAASGTGPGQQNMGNWSLYAVHARDAISPTPEWVVEKLVTGIHTGNVCIGLMCEQKGSDPAARFAGDLLGSWVDQQGLGHIAFQIGGNSMYIRQDWVYYP